MIKFLTVCCLLIGSIAYSQPISGDSVGVGYRERIGERIGSIGVLRKWQLSRFETMVDVTSNVTDRQLPGSTPHRKESAIWKHELRYLTTSNWFAGYRLQGEWFRDQRSMVVNRVNYRSGPIYNFELPSYALLASGERAVQQRARWLFEGGSASNAGEWRLGTGVAMDRDQDAFGSGWCGSVAAKLNDITLAEWGLDGDAKYERMWLRPREDASGALSLNVIRQGKENDASMLFSTDVSHTLKDISGAFPFRRQQWNGTAHAEVDFQPTPAGTWRTTGDWEGSQIRQGTLLPASSHLRQEYRIQWKQQNRFWFTESEYSTGWQTSRSGKQIQNDRNEEIVVRSGWLPTLRDSVTIGVQGSVVRTDTPESTDGFDRDATRYSMELTGSHQWASDLRIHGDLQFVESGNRYLSALTSASNVAARTYLMGGELLHFLPHGVHWFRSEIVATYLLYQFQLPTQPNRDVLSRRWSVLDSGVVRLLDGEFGWSIRQDWEDRGLFDRERYEQSVSEAFTTFVGTVEYSQSMWKTVTGFGLQAYRRRPDRFEKAHGATLVNREHEVAGLGPVFHVYRNVSAGWRIYGNAVLLVVSRSARGRYMQNDVSFTFSRVW